jgi:capsular polysaccharide biosynthesis protein
MFRTTSLDIIRADDGSKTGAGALIARCNTHPIAKASSRGQHIALPGEPSTFAGLYRIQRDEVGPLGVYICNDLHISSRLIPYLRSQVWLSSDVVPHYLRREVLSANEGRWTDEPQVVKRYCDDVAIFAVSKSLIGYGHWFIDILPRFWLHAQLRGETTKRIRVILPSYTPKFGYELLEMLGQNFEPFVFSPGKEVVQAELAIVPTLVHNDYTFHSAFIDFIAFLRAKVGPGRSDGHERLFVSRRKYKDRSTGRPRELENEAEVEATLAARGFRTIFNEELTLADKMTLYGGAKVLCGEAGAALEHAMFMGENSLVISLGAMNDVQCQIAKLLGHRIAFLPVETVVRDGFAFLIAENAKLVDLLSKFGL